MLVLEKPMEMDTLERYMVQQALNSPKKNQKRHETKSDKVKQQTPHLALNGVGSNPCAPTPQATARQLAFGAPMDEIDKAMSIVFGRYNPKTGPRNDPLDAKFHNTN